MEEVLLWLQRQTLPTVDPQQATRHVLIMQRLCFDLRLRASFARELLKEAGYASLRLQPFKVTVGTWTHPDRVPGSFVAMLTLRPPMALPIEDVRAETPRSLWCNQLRVLSELDLQKAVVKYIRERWPHLVMAPGLGDITGQFPEHRLEAFLRGYTAGQPDLLIACCNQNYTGLAIEFKSPGGLGKLDPKQDLFLKRLAAQGWLTLVTSSFAECVEVIAHFARGVKGEPAKAESSHECPFGPLRS